MTEDQLRNDQDCREFVKQDFLWVANFLIAKFKMDVKRVKALMREMLTVTV